MKHCMIGLTAIAACGSAPLAAQATAPADDWSKRADAFLEQLFALELSPAMAIAVVKKDEVVYLRGFGHRDAKGRDPTTPDTVFYIASTTKSFTGMAASILHERQTIDLDGSLKSYMRDADYHPGIDPGQITLRELLNHTHGIANGGPIVMRLAYSGDHDPQTLRALMRHHGPAPKGREFEYGNLGYNVATMALDRELGKGWKDVLAELIFAPLGMKSTTGYRSRIVDERLAWPFRTEPEGFAPISYTKNDANMHSAGGLLTTARDLARWLEVNLNEGRLEGEQALPAAAVAAAHEPTARQSGRMFSFTREGYGLGWMTGRYGDDKILSHFGGYSGFHSHVSFMPEQGIGVAVLVNTARPGILLADAAARYVYDSLRGEKIDAAHVQKELERARRNFQRMRDAIRADREKRAARPQGLPHALEAYAGKYANPAFGELQIRVVDGKLQAHWGLCQSDIEVFDAERNALRHELTGTGEVLFFDFAEGATHAASCRTSDGVVLTRKQSNGRLPA